MAAFSIIRGGAEPYSASAEWLLKNLFASPLAIGTTAVLSGFGTFAVFWRESLGTTAVLSFAGCGAGLVFPGTYALTFSVSSAFEAVLF